MGKQGGRSDGEREEGRGQGKWDTGMKEVGGSHERINEGMFHDR